MAGHADEIWHELASHPVAPACAAVTLAASLGVHGDRLLVRFRLRGPLMMLSLPAASRAPGRCDRLWEHTCFEAFVGAAQRASYVEVNLSPSGDWAIWAFDDYREGMRPALPRDSPILRVWRAADQLRSEASISLSGLREEIGASPYRVGLAAVLEDRAGKLSYWACRHPGNRPDFHARAGWPGTIYLPPLA